MYSSDYTKKTFVDNRKSKVAKKYKVFLNKKQLKLDILRESVIV